MSIKERLLQIQQEGEGLANRIDQKRKLTELKQRLTQPGGVVLPAKEENRKPKEMLVDTGLLDMLSEAVDYIPWVEVNIHPKPEGMGIYTDYAILLSWERQGALEAEMSWKELGVAIKSDAIIIYSALYFMPVPGTPRDLSSLFSRDSYIKERYSQDSLKLEQWQDRERLESSIADALWAAGVRPAEANKEVPQ